MCLQCSIHVGAATVHDDHVVCASEKSQNKHTQVNWVTRHLEQLRSCNLRLVPASRSVLIFGKMTMTDL